MSNRARPNRARPNRAPTERPVSSPEPPERTVFAQLYLDTVADHELYAGGWFCMCMPANDHGYREPFPEASAEEHIANAFAARLLATAQERLTDKLTWVDYHAQHDATENEVMARLALGLPVSQELVDATSGLGYEED